MGWGDVIAGAFGVEIFHSKCKGLSVQAVRLSKTHSDSITTSDCASSIIPGFCVISIE